MPYGTAVGLRLGIARVVYSTHQPYTNASMQFGPEALAAAHTATASSDS